MDPRASKPMCFRLIKHSLCTFSAHFDTVHPSPTSCDSVIWHDLEPINEDKHCLEDLNLLTFRKDTWHILSVRAGMACALRPLTDKATLRCSYISADQSQRPGVLHQPSEWYLDLLPPHFVHKLYVLMQSYARESIVYIAPLLIANEWEIECLWQVFLCHQAIWFSCLRVWTLWCSRSTQKLTCIQWISNHFWPVVWATPAVTSADALHQNTSLQNGKSWAGLKLMIKLFI